MRFSLLEALQTHWPEYAMEAALLGLFMISACSFGTLLGYPNSPAHRTIQNPATRRILMGMAMGLTAITLIYSPWGQQSGAHMNPAVTLTFLRLGKITAADALYYVASQFIGGITGVMVSHFLLRHRLRHHSVNFVATLPGRWGESVAWFAECTIAFVMMFAVLLSSNHSGWAPYTGFIAGTLVALYITFEAPLSGMSMNPARTFGSAVHARQWKTLWIYLTAPLIGMMSASVAYGALPSHPVLCAKLNHTAHRRCIFRCDYGHTAASNIPSSGQKTP